MPPDNDYPLILVDEARQIATEMWEATPDNAEATSWTVSQAGQYAWTPGAAGIPDANRHPIGATALSAAGISYTATLLTQADVAAGMARHMLAFASPVGYAPFVAPAQHTDLPAAPPGVDASHWPAEGRIFRFPAQTVIRKSWPRLARIIAAAVRDYGMVIVDYAGAPQFQAQAPLAGYGGPHDAVTAAMDGLPEYEVLQALPWHTLECVAPPEQWPRWRSAKG